MKIGRYFLNEKERLAAVIKVDGVEKAIDVTKVAQSLQIQLSFVTMEELIESGFSGLDKLNAMLQKATQIADPKWCLAINDVPWDIPVQARSILCAGRNFGRHKDESMKYWTQQGTTGIHFDFPTGFIKLAHTLVPHCASVARPADVLEFDYEIEVVAILSKPTFNVSEKDALSHVFGYTVFNDLSAREWQKKEMQNQMILIGKNFPGFGPIGPWILTADEVPDPSRLVIDLKVNGQTVQHESCSDMIFNFQQLISFWSKSGLTAGDMIASGTPEGVAMHRKPDPFAFYLKPGDVVHASVEGIGMLETRIPS
jgi:2-keto-4-pentenoate hydratase/2-oxohepta-3-ene-1,7-dioic acid hydratase in catechol pathway